MYQDMNEVVIELNLFSKPERQLFLYEGIWKCGEVKQGAQGARLGSARRGLILQCCSRPLLTLRPPFHPQLCFSVLLLPFLPWLREPFCNLLFIFLKWTERRWSEEI